jgi:hypothetical protein
MAPHIFAPKPFYLCSSVAKNEKANLLVLRILLVVEPFLKGKTHVQVIVTILLGPLRFKRRMDHLFSFSFSIPTGISMVKVVPTPTSLFTRMVPW